SSTLVSFIVAGFFYYCFFFFLRRELPMRVLFSNVIFAHLPAMVLYTLSPLVPPLILVGLAVTGILVIVGLVENLKVPKTFTIRIVGGLFLLFVVFWIVNVIDYTVKNKDLEKIATPQSMDI